MMNRLKTVTITHNTDGTGAIDTAAGSLVTALNTDVTVGAIIQSAMGEAGTVDFEGTVQLANWEIGLVCKANQLFKTPEDKLLLSLAECDGIANASSDFKSFSPDA